MTAPSPHAGRLAALPPAGLRLLMIRTGRKEFREYLLSPIGEHYQVHMYLGLEPSWELEHIAGATVIGNTLDTDLMIATAKAMHAETPFDGVMTWDESRTPQTAAIAAALGLPGGHVDAIGRCRDKHQTRLALGAAGVPQPRSARVDGVDEALRVAGEFGYPVVIKPSDLALSIGVQRVDTPEELVAAFPSLSQIKVWEVPDYQIRPLVEECVIGEEISIDAAVHHGKVYPLCIARKQVGFPPHSIEIGHYVDGNDPLLDDPGIQRLLEDLHAALGFTDGVTHTEVMLTADGPRIIEVNGRLGGDLIPYLGRLATGVDTGLAAAAVACGLAPSSVRDRNVVAGIRFLHPAQDRTLIENVHFERDGLPDCVTELVVLAEPGERWSTPLTSATNCRIAYAVAVAPTVAEVMAGLEAAEAALVVTGKPE